MNLRQPEFWTATIALLALILSQLSPIKELIKPRVLRIVLPEHLVLYHFLGNLQLLGYTALHNTGGREVTVAKVACIIKDEEGHRWEMPAQTYLSRQAPAVPGAQPPEPIMGWISLRPGEHWAETVHFHRIWTVQEEEEATRINAGIRANISDKLSKREPGESNKPAEADKEPVEEAVKFFEKSFSLVKGNFKFLVEAVSERGEILCVKGFDFTLFESQLRALRSAADDYKIGAGIFFPNPDISRLAVIRLRPLPDDEAKRLRNK
jgi:hypothetical protein